MTYVFGDCELNTNYYTLSRKGKTERLQPRVYKILLYLLEHRDQVVSKDELCEQVWPERFIANSTLESAMRQVRQAVGDSGKNQRVIATAWGYGYRFVADVVEHPDIQDVPPALHETETTAASWQPARPALAPSPFVGRQRELSLLHDLLEQAESGQGRVAMLTGAPGMGKSRLLKTFSQSLREGRVTYLYAACEFNRTAKPYLPMLSLLRQSCGILPGDSAATMTEKMDRHWREIGLDPDDNPSYLLSLLGVQSSRERLAALRPAWVHMRTIAAFCRMLLASCRQRPLLLAIEDLQWLDGASQACLSSLTDNLDNVPILLLTTCRPAYRPPWMDKSFSADMPLSPLTAHESLSMLQAMLAPEPTIPSHLERAILATAAGNPLCLEALIRLIATSETSAAHAPLPDNLQDILDARIAQLADGPKRLLQTAAVLGAPCSRRVLEAMWEGPENLDTCLLALGQHAYYEEQPHAGEPVYAFSHALIQNAVYNRLSAPRLQALHTAAGQALEVLHASRLDTVSDLLAHHYRHTGQDEKAIQALARLAETIARHGRYPEAIAALQEAQTRADRRPGEQPMKTGLDLTLRHAQSLFAMGHWQETVTLLTQRTTPWDQLQDFQLESRYTLLLSRAYARLEQWVLADQQARHAQEAAARYGDDAIMGQACHVLAEVHYGCERFSEGMALSQQAVDLLVQPTERVQLGMAHLTLGFNALFSGDFECALNASEQARAIGTAMGDPHLPSLAYGLSGWTQTTCGSWETGMQACQRSLEESPDPLTAALAQGWLGHAYLERGEADQAISLLMQAVEQMRQFQRRRFGALYTTFLGEAYLLRHDLDAAREWIGQGLTLAQEASYHTGMAWATRALGRLHRVADALAESEYHLQASLGLFEAKQVRFESARTRLDLARLMHLKGCRETAAAHLIEASQAFNRLHVPAYTERAQQCAHQLGLPALP